jgi:ABC-type transporter Mla subunit MlaD
MAQTPLEPGHGSTRGTPRWVKLFGIIALVLVLLFAISLLAGVRHGPGLHTPSGDAGGDTRLSSVAAHAEQPSW